MNEFDLIMKLGDIPVRIIEFLRSAEFLRLIAVLKSVSAVVSALLFLGIITVIVKTGMIASKVESLAHVFRQSSFPKTKIIKNWALVTRRLQSYDEASFKLALIEADKIFDDLLKRIGYAGETMAERLKRINTAQISNIDSIWQAHKLRNQLVHNPDFHLTHGQVREAVEAYESAMKELEILE